MYSEQSSLTYFQNSGFQLVTPQLKQLVDMLYGSQPSLLKELFYFYTSSHNKRIN